MRIYLELPDDANVAEVSRLGYAFRLFCGIYGHQPVLEGPEAECCDVVLRYDRPGLLTLRGGERVVWLSRGYRERDPHSPAPPPVRYNGDGVQTVLHWLPEEGNSPDWLGEIFEWVSCADEYSVTQRDEAGRPAFAATYFGRYRLDPGIPYAGIAMKCLQRAICRVVPRAAEVAERPSESAHLVVPTHDVDYFPVGRWHAVNRLGRNAVISLTLNKHPRTGMRQARMAASVAMGRVSDPLHNLMTLANQERQHGVFASYNFLARHAHRRDCHYSLADPNVVKSMVWLQSQGMEIGIHGSYTSLDTPDGLHRELSQFHSQGLFPEGGRQHWLRYTLERLIPAVEHAGLRYDMSMGWSATIGFRAGACFAFPPYYFAEERAANFLEIPLIVMEQGFDLQRDVSEVMYEKATALMSRSRAYGWGGVSLLWHPAAFGDGWLPAQVGDIYWRLAAQRRAWGDEWMRAQDFVATVRQRYVDAGLLQAANGVPAEELPADERAGADSGTRRKVLQKRYNNPPAGVVGT